MKKARIVAREQIFKNMKQCSDDDLKILDEIYYSPYEEFAENQTSQEIFEYLEKKYIRNYEDFRVKSVEVEFCE